MIVRSFKRFTTLFACSIVCASGTLGADIAQAVEPYVGVQGGVHFWPAYSNRDQVEADTGPGFSWSATGGIVMQAESWGPAPPGHPVLTTLSERLGVRVEAEVGQRFSDIHGINDNMGQRTGDGKGLSMVHVHLSAWPSWKIASGWTYYAGGGVGASWLRALGSDAVVHSFQVGTGLLIDLPIGRFTPRLDLGWRSVFVDSVELRDRLTDFDAHGGIIGFQFPF